MDTAAIVKMKSITPMTGERACILLLALKCKIVLLTARKVQGPCSAKLRHAYSMSARLLVQRFWFTAFIDRRFSNTIGPGTVNHA